MSLFNRYFRVFILNFPTAQMLIMPNIASVKINQTKELCAYIIAKAVCKKKLSSLR